MPQTHLPSPIPERRPDSPVRGNAVVVSSLTPDGDGWVYTDACVLTAIRVTGTPEEPASLADIIAAGDFLHHMILSPQEIEHAVGRLISAMLVTTDERGLAITQLGREVVARARGGTLNRVEVLLRILHLVQASPAPWVLDRREYEAACLEHRHRFWKAYGRRSRGSRF